MGEIETLIALHVFKEPGIFEMYENGSSLSLFLESTFASFNGAKAVMCVEAHLS